MKKSIKFRFGIIFFPLMLSLALLAVACGGAGPLQREIAVKLTAGQLDPGTIKVGQNDTVTLKIEADQPGSVHLHGYDLEQDVASGDIIDFVFLADASGRFRIAFHAAGVDHHQTSGGHHEVADGEEVDVGFLEVQPR